VGEVIKKKDPATVMRQLEDETKAFLAAHPEASDAETASFEFDLYSGALADAVEEGNELLESALAQKRDDAARRRGGG
jgi:hemerythrin